MQSQTKSCVETSSIKHVYPDCLKCKRLIQRNIAKL